MSESCLVVWKTDPSPQHTHIGIGSRTTGLCWVQNHWAVLHILYVLSYMILAHFLVPELLPQETIGRCGLAAPCRKCSKALLLSVRLVFCHHLGCLWEPFQPFWHTYRTLDKWENRSLRINTLSSVSPAGKSKAHSTQFFSHLLHSGESKISEAKAQEKPRWGNKWKWGTGEESGIFSRLRHRIIHCSIPLKVSWV